MTFIKNIYLNPKSIKKTSIINKFSKNSFFLNTYFICIDFNSNNISEIITPQQIKNFKNKDYLCIGIAEGELNAFLLFKDIISDYLKFNNNLKDFKIHFESLKK